MWTESRQPAPGYRGTRTATGPTPGRMAIAFVLSWVAMLAHDQFELPAALRQPPRATPRIGGSENA